MSWNQVEAIKLCKSIEQLCPEYGYHVALTGGCLYKEGERKDLDILFYQIRQYENPDRKGLIRRISSQIENVGASESYGWMTKIYAERGTIDVFFPEDEVGDYISTADLDPAKSMEAITLAPCPQISELLKGNTVTIEVDE